VPRHRRVRHRPGRTRALRGTGETTRRPSAVAAAATGGNGHPRGGHDGAGRCADGRRAPRCTPPAAAAPAAADAASARARNAAPVTGGQRAIATAAASNLRRGAGNGRAGCTPWETCKETQEGFCTTGHTAGWL